VLLLSITTAIAGVAPKMIHYQAMLENSNGDPVTTQTQVTFRIYDAATSKAILWEETRMVSPDESGMFSISLGETEPVNEDVFSAAERWLGITVGTDSELTPRTRLVSSPYSMRVETIDQAEAGALKGPLVLEESTQRGALPYLELVGTMSESVKICASSCPILRVTNQDGQEVVNLNTEGANNSALFIVKGPGGDDQAEMSSEGMELWTDFGRGDRALQKAVVLHANEGLAVLSSANPNDTLIHIWEGAGRGIGYVKLVDPATNEACILSTGENAIQVFDANENLQVSIGLDQNGGGDVTLWDGSARTKELSNKVMAMDKDGYHMFDATGLSDLITLHSDGNITGQRKIAVGEGCTADGDWSVCFGFNNTASGDSSTVSGGYNNTAAGWMSTVGGGAYNEALASSAVISGGYENVIESNGAGGTIGGGLANYLDSLGTTISGGYGDTAVGYCATVSGGLVNKALRYGATVGGGGDNTVTVDGIYGTIAGGSANTVNEVYGFVGGGNNNTAGAGDVVSGGNTNSAIGGYSAIPGGWYNMATGQRSFAAGWSARAENLGTVVFSSTGSSDTAHWVSSNNSCQFVVRAVGGVYFTDNSQQVTVPSNNGHLITTNTGAYLTSGGVWTDAPKMRGEIRPVDGSQILGNLERLPVNEYGSEVDGSIRRVGPMPQDFHEIFGVGADKESIAASDMAGVALAAVKELYRMVQAQQQLAQELQSKDKKIEELEVRLTQMEAMVETILAQQNNTGNDKLAVNR